MDYIYTVIDEQMVDYSPSDFDLVGVFLSLEEAQEAGREHLADPAVRNIADDRLLSVMRALPGERNKAEWLGNLSPKGEWVPKGQLTPIGFYHCQEA